MASLQGLGGGQRSRVIGAAAGSRVIAPISSIVRCTVRLNVCSMVGTLFATRLDLFSMIQLQYSSSAACVLKRDSATDITITQMFITLAIMLEVY